ncbi:MAG: LytR/AlgR family response regulator transcription factor [Marinifilaceae bacterium]
MKLSCVIIDDEPLAVSLLESYVKKTPFLELKGTYNNAITALDNLNRESVDLLFLDIQMPELNGLELSAMIKSDTRIIFTTAFDQYALDSYRVNALDYLLKPISYADFLAAANKALHWYELIRKSAQPEVPTAQESIFIKADYKLIQVDLANILYIEGLKDYVQIFMEPPHKKIVSLMSMKSLEEQLPSQQFIRVHRSFIVRLDKITVIERNRIVFGDTYIPISDSYKDQLFDTLKKRSIFVK